MKQNSIRVTYAVDAQTVLAIDELAREWEVSKSEAVRRAVRLARERVNSQFARMSPLEVLDHSLRAPTRSKREVEAWQEEAAAMRKSWGDDR
jgi:Arc/MetJ-type ribon-helix-helix transcriptional regulator